MHSFWSQSPENQEENLRKERRETARKIYQSIAQLPKSSNCQKQVESQNIKTSNQEGTSKTRKLISNEDSLLLMTELSEGKTIAQITRQSELFRQFELKNVQNFYNCTLNKLCNNFAEVLPKSVCTLDGKTLRETYLKNPPILKYYYQQGINLPDLFAKLFFIKQWEKQYKDYLLKGYGSDYLPDNIIDTLSLIPAYFGYIKQAHEAAHASCPPKPKKAPKNIKNNNKTSTNITS